MVGIVKPRRAHGPARDGLSRLTTAICSAGEFPHAITSQHARFCSTRRQPLLPLSAPSAKDRGETRMTASTNVCRVRHCIRGDPTPKLATNRRWICCIWSRPVCAVECKATQYPGACERKSVLGILFKVHQIYPVSKYLYGRRCARHNQIHSLSLPHTDVRCQHRIDSEDLITRISIHSYLHS